MKRLKLFDLLDTLSNDSTIHSGTESEIFENLENIIARSDGKKTLLIAHCHDEVIMSYGLRRHINNLKNILAQNPTIHIILITMYPYKDLPSIDNFMHIYMPEWQGIYWDLYSGLEPTDGLCINKKFLSLNKRADPYRQALYYLFYSHDWLNNNIFSYLCENAISDNIADDVSWLKMHSIALNLLKGQDIKIPSDICHYVKDDNLLQIYRNKVKVQGIDPTWLIERSWYVDTFCSLIIETDSDDLFPNLSEKTFRSICMQHPISLFCSIPSLSYINSLGFEQDGFSYISDFNECDRFSAYIRHIADIAKATLADLTELRIHMQERLVWNRSVYSKLHGKLKTRETEILEAVKAQILKWGFEL